MRMQLADDWYERLDTIRQELADIADDAYDAVTRLLERQQADLAAQRKLASALNPAVALARGFAIVRGADGQAIRHASQVAANDIVRIGISDAELTARVDTIKRK
jgi:exodeoxyribonuclease VII large subunit